MENERITDKETATNSTEWKRNDCVTYTLRIVHTKTNGQTSQHYEEYGDSYTDPLKRSIDIDVSHEDRHVDITHHSTEHYSLTLHKSLVPGYLGMDMDTLTIGVMDGKQIRHIHRYIDNCGSPDVTEYYSFENNEIIDYEGRPTTEYHTVQENEIRKLVRTSCPGFTNGIPDDRSAVTDPALTPHYESFKRLRPDVSESLDACITALKWKSSGNKN